MVGGSHHGRSKWQPAWGVHEGEWTPVGATRSAGRVGQGRYLALLVSPYAGTGGWVGSL